MDTKQIRSRRWLVVLLLILLMVGAGASIALGQSGGGYNLEWNTASNGGRLISTAFPPHDLNGCAGQPAAGGAMTGGKYSLSSGFCVELQPYHGYLPAVRK